VLDPFCGSGTVLLEAITTRRDAIGADSNPLARLISKTKVTPLRPSKLHAWLSRILTTIPDERRSAPPRVVNVDYWFYPHVQRDLSRLLSRIGAIHDDAVKDFFLVTLSSCVRRVSLADPRLSVPVRLRLDQYARTHWLYERTQIRLKELRHINVLEVFENLALDNIQRMESLAIRSNLGCCRRIEDDARQLRSTKSSSVDLIITSPPYLGAQKYIRASSLSLTWLGMCSEESLRQVEDLNIGREHYKKAATQESPATAIPAADKLISQVRATNALRAHMAARYLLEMRDALKESARVLRPGRHMVLIAGASGLCGFRFPTPDYLVQLARACGMQLRLHLIDTIRSRALMTKRHRSAGRIDTESILLFQKA